jgi:hypothetical protein
MKRALGIRERRQRRIGVRLAMAAVIAASLGVLAFALGLQPEDPAQGPVGVTHRDAYRAVDSGLTKPQVRRVLGGLPSEVETSPLQLDAPECWVYDRLSGREGGYRFCFRGEVLETKTRI